LEYAFFNADKQQCHCFAYCKDFLQDALWAALNDKKASIYGFSYNPEKDPPVDLKKTRIGLRLRKDKDFAAKCERALQFVNEVEEQLGFPYSRVEAAGNYKDTDDTVFVFVGSKKWMHSTVTLSLYTLLLRIGMSYTGGPWRKHFDAGKNLIGKNDDGYARRAQKGIDKILSTSLTKLFNKTMAKNYPANVDIYDLHEESGIVTFSEGGTAEPFTEAWSSK
jgi:hypothetical protein